MKVCISFLIFLCGLQAWSVRHIVLVPGFFSSAIPAPVVGGNPWKQPYFSQTVVKYLSKTGDRLWVVDNLSPLGGVEENGRRLVSFLETHQNEMQGSLLLIAHSAGGLYSIYAAAHSDFPIDHIITVSTPFEGLKFLEALDEKGIPVESVLSQFCLKNLLGLRQQSVVDFLNGIRFHRPLRLDVWAGYQKAKLSTWDWSNLSAPLVPVQALIGEKSDGIVSVRSSLAAIPLLGRKANLNLQIHQNPIGLEHWEFVLDPELSLALGVLNFNGLRGAQEWAYHDLLVQSGY